jgi:hypothetical protein
MMMMMSTTNLKTFLMPPLTKTWTTPLVLLRLAAKRLEAFVGRKAVLAAGLLNVGVNGVRLEKAKILAEGEDRLVEVWLGRGLSAERILLPQCP